MPNYKRVYQPGGYYFFTLVTAQRQAVFRQERHVALLRKIWRDVAIEHPFETIGCCVLPDHIHAVWRLPPDDCDYSGRWQRIKGRFSRQFRSGSVWQKGYWEHALRSDVEVSNHLDYLHFNPVKHGYVERVVDWPWSSFHRYVRAGLLPLEWGSLEPSVANLPVGE